MIWSHIRGLIGVEVCVCYRDLFTMKVDVDKDPAQDDDFYATLFDWDAEMDNWSELNSLHTRHDRWRKELKL